jgi:predicted O-methyltransferase YrrM
MGRNRSPGDAGTSSSPELWSETDAFFEGLFLRDDGALGGALEASRAAGLPEIQVSPLQGRMLHLLALSIGARRILEIGLLGGYSTIWLARALPVDGRLVSLEVNARHAGVARANLARAGVGDRVEIRVGDARRTLPSLPADPPFDFVFIDADKSNAAEYYREARRLTRPWGLIVVDNVVRAGAVRDPSDPDPNVAGTRRLLETMASDAGALVNVMQTVGRKGHDGWAIGLVLPSDGSGGHWGSAELPRRAR